MDVNKLNAIAPLASGKDKDKRRPKEEKGEEGGHANSGEEWGEDRISVMGVSPAEMTPNVEKAINLLLQEVGHLREQLSKSREHEAYLERHADEHGFLPVLSRRGFTQRLNQILLRAAQTNVDSCFLYLHVFNAEAVRTDMGSGAEEALLKLVADVLNREFGDGAVIGSLGNADFGIILPATGREEGDGTTRRVVAMFDSETTLWQGVPLKAKVLHGLSVFSADGEADAILAEADRDLLDRSRRRADAGAGTGN